MQETSVLLYLVLFCAVGVTLVAKSAHIRHSHGGETQMKAWFIQLPGWRESYSPEDTVSLVDWVGSSLDSVTATVNGIHNPEFGAGIALKATGLFSDYVLEQRGEHFVLHKPAVTTRYFTLKAIYRVSRWTIVSP